jgi:hypothetical protein
MKEITPSIPFLLLLTIKKEWREYIASEEDTSHFTKPAKKRYKMKKN